MILCFEFPWSDPVRNRQQTNVHLHTDSTGSCTATVADLLKTRRQMRCSGVESARQVLALLLRAHDAEPRLRYCLVSPVARSRHLEEDEVGEVKQGPPNNHNPATTGSRVPFTAASDNRATSPSAGRLHAGRRQGQLQLQRSRPPPRRLVWGRPSPVCSRRLSLSPLPESALVTGIREDAKLQPTSPCRMLTWQERML
jgi:hypothetical protein